ncbi:MAG: radical SAM protein [Chitinivibrionales bacterium]|nr:radical SAM protein [Chitinivibrionales bacterium]
MRELVDKFGRAITYLRISVTDKCNYRCTYCMPACGIEHKPHAQILRYEEIAQIVRVAVLLGISKVRLTGGEPLVKRNIEHLVGLVADTPGIGDVAMTTNASLLTGEVARALTDAGLQRVNISLDTLDPERFRTLTRGGDIRHVFRGIDAAIYAGLAPVKVNMIVFDDTPAEEVDRMRQFCTGKGARLQTIRHFTLSDRQLQPGPLATDRPLPCEECNRLRLTADGYVKPCLHSDKEIKVNMQNISGSILEAVNERIKSGVSCSSRVMSQIGG